MSGERPPTSCEYETADGRPCPHVARARFTLRQATAPLSISGEPVKFFANACTLHAAKVRHHLPAGIVIDTEEEL